MSDSRHNSRKRFTVEFEAADILIMADALSIGSTTAAMCGGGKAGERLHKLSDMFRDMSPLPKSNRSEGYEWFQACRLLKDAPWFEAFVTVDGRSWNRDKAHVDVDIGGKVVRVCENVDKDEAIACVEPLNEFLVEIAGVDAHRLVRMEAEVALPEGSPRWGDEFRAATKAAVEALVAGSGLTCIFRKADYSHATADPAAKVTVSVPAHERDAVLSLLQDGASVAPSMTR